VVPYQGSNHKKPNSDNGKDQSSEILVPPEIEQKTRYTDETNYKEESPEDEANKLFHEFFVSKLPAFVKKITPGEWLLAFVGSVAAIIYILQFNAFEKSTRDATQTQILMKMPLIIPDVNDLNWNNTPSKDGPSIFVVEEFRNIGETRAIGVNIVWGWGHDLPNVHFDKRDTYNSEAAWIWMPKYAEKRRVIMPIDEARDLAEFKKPLYVYGQIRYMDLFPSDTDFGLRTDHLVEYCFKILSIDTGEKTKGVTTKWDWVPCPGQPFCADNDCPAEDYYHPYKPH
jgi:hypothetical protein